MAKKNQMTKRHALIPASYVVLKKDDKILLARRYNTAYGDGQYSLPSGHVEEGETFVKALIREIKEEINIDIDPKDAHITHIMHQDSHWGFDALRCRLDVFFSC